ncbi:MAG: substrate-binding domain-containing protein [Alphaproteobacteria bacterium]|nr:substrate-binding domain-containing protein [Alphaproteobacteria bacterium]
MNRLPVLLGLLAACSAPTPAPSQADKPLLRVGGSETMGRSLLPALVEAHQKSKRTLRFEVSGGGSGAGIRQLLDGTLDIATSSRKHRFADEEQAKANGFSLEERGARQVIGMDVVAVVVNEQSPIQELTYDQVIGIFCDGTIDDMQFLGEGLPSQPLVALTRDPRSGTRALFEDFFCGPRGIHPRLETRDSAAIGDAVRENPAMISFSTMTEQGVRFVPLKPDAASPAIVPSQKTIANGSYPLYHDLYLYTAGPASGHAKEFVDWVLSPAGQEIVDEQRFVPIYHRSKELDGPRPLRETIHFDAGENYPNQRSVARIQLLVQELRGRKAGKGQHIVLEGYADSTEKEPVRLSEERANAVKDLLGQQLTDPFFEIIPRGATRPLAPNTTPYGRLRNRRVQIYLADEEAERDEAVVGRDDLVVEQGG